MGLGDDFYAGLTAAFAAKRDRLCAGLVAAGLEPLPSAGTYFVNALVEGDAAEFCRSLPGRAGVVAIPAAVFYDHPDFGRSLVRFAFCKRDSVIDEAAARLAAVEPRCSVTPQLAAAVRERHPRRLGGACGAVDESL